MEKQLFSFMENVHKDLAIVGCEIETKLFVDPTTVLLKGRVYAEQLTKLVNEKEGIEELYGIKQHERLYKLNKEQIMIDDIYNRFEWLRKSGNKAAHEANFGKVEDAIEAHRYLYDVSVWFMEVYGDLSFKAPVYKLPHAQTTSSIDKDELEIVLNESISKMFGEKFDAVLDLVQKNVENQTQEQAESSTATEEAAVAVEQKNVVSASEGNQISLVDYLEGQELEVVDKRSAGGTIWVIGGWELNDVLFALKEYKIYFRYSKKGSRSTKNQEAWFLLNKTKEELYVERTEEKSLEGKKLLDEKENEREELKGVNQVAAIEDKLQDSAIREHENQNQQVKLDKSGQIKSIKEEQENKEEIIVKRGPLLSILQSVQLKDLNDTGIRLPEQLFKREWRTAPLGVLLEKNMISLENITLELMRAYYMENREAFFSVMMQLGFLGAEFSGSLASLATFVPEKQEGYFYVHNAEKHELKEIFPLHFRSLLRKHNIYTVNDINYLPVSSLKWLFKDFMEELLLILAKCDEKNIQKENSSPNFLNFTDVEVTSSGEEKKLFFNEQSLVLPNYLLEQNLTFEYFPNCKNIVKQLKKQGIETFGELPEVLDDLPNQLMGVGTGTMNKFLTVLIELSGNNPVNDENPHQSPVLQGEGVYFSGKSITFSDLFGQQYIAEGIYESVDIILNHLKETGIETYQHLPANLDELKQIQGCGRGRIEKFFNQIEQNQLRFAEESKYQSLLDSMTDEEKDRYFFDNYIRTIDKIVKDENEQKRYKINSRGLQMLKKKHEATLQGEHLTLEAIAQVYDITRERVRQIIKKILNQLVELNQSWMAKLITSIKKNEVIYNQFLNKQIFSHYIVMETLQQQGFDFVFEDQLITIWDKKMQESIDANFYPILQSAFKGKIFTKEDLMSVINDYDIYALYAEHASKQWTVETEVGGFILKSTSKADIVEMILRKYPQGIAVYKKAEELCREANEIVPTIHYFASEREFTSVVSRDEFTAAYLWGRGFYIHRNYVKIPKELLRKIDMQIAKWLKSQPTLMIIKVYEYFKEELIDQHIPNEYALYTLLREVKCDNGVSYPKFPNILQEGQEVKYKSEMITDFIKENGPFVSIELLSKEFIDKLGWKEFTLSFNLSSKDEFIQDAPHSYTLLEFYNHVTEEQLQMIVNKLDNKLSVSPFFQATGLFIELEAYCRSLGITSPYLLYGILKGRFAEEFIFPRYPHILKQGVEADSVSMIKIVESYLLEQQCEVSREELLQWMTEDVGGNARIIDIALANSDNIFYYTRGQYGEYVHKDVIGWDKQKAEQVRGIVLEGLKEQTEEVFVLAKDIDLECLPDLDIDLEWTETLLIDCVQRDELFCAFGSLRAIFVNRNDGIMSNTDFVHHLLVKYFEGAVKISELKKLLQKVHYTSDGDLLHENLVEIESGEAPFVIEGDELISKSLMNLGG